MNGHTLAAIGAASLPALIDRASRALTGARSSAEILEARELAGVAYDVAKRAGRFAKVKGAHDTLIAVAHRAQADALEIEAGAKRRLADEYDAAQPPEAKKGGRPKTVPNENGFTAASAGLSRKEIHEAREVRDAEEANPGVVRRALDEALETGKEPTRAKVKRAVKAKSKSAKVKSKRKKTRRTDPNAMADTQHDRDLRALMGMWEASCETARQEFLKVVTQQ